MSPVTAPTGGEVFIRGRAGERFCVRNSGVNTVVEGVGDHGCEYMTKGTVVVIGPTGRNFAAGMSGGYAFILDEDGKLPKICNMGMVDLVPLDADEDIDLVQSLLRKHIDATGSERALWGARKLGPVAIQVRQGFPARLPARARSPETSRSQAGRANRLRPACRCDERT